MQCGAGIAFVNIIATQYNVVANATLPGHARVALARATSKALYVIVSVSALASESSTANNIPEGGVACDCLSLEAEHYLGIQWLKTKRKTTGPK